MGGSSGVCPFASGAPSSSNRVSGWAGRAAVSFAFWCVRRLSRHRALGGVERPSLSRSGAPSSSMSAHGAGSGGHLFRVQWCSVVYRVTARVGRAAILRILSLRRHGRHHRAVLASCVWCSTGFLHLPFSRIKRAGRPRCYRPFRRPEFRHASGTTLARASMTLIAVPLGGAF
jgi:hypothetical protein